MRAFGGALSVSLAIGVAIGVAIAPGCGVDDAPAVDAAASVDAAAGADATAATIPYDTLAEYGLFAGDPADQLPADGVVPYDVNVTLFADYTIKLRFVYVPDGAVIGYSNDGRWELPVGTIVIKTFAYPVDLRDPDGDRRLLETRLLIHTEQGWRPHAYRWDDAQTEATCLVAGAQVQTEWIHTDAQTRANDYRIPNTNQCLGCHGDTGSTNVIGLKTRQIERDHDYGAGPVSQVDHFASLGLLDPAPPPADQRPVLPDVFGAAPVAERARGYLDVNCGHCHSPTGAAAQSGLQLTLETTTPNDFGVCRRPVAAGPAAGGRQFDIIPGDPDGSILVFRMASVDPEIRLPEVGRNLAHDEAVAVVRAWIEQMTPAGCPE